MEAAARLNHFCSPALAGPQMVAKILNPMQLEKRQFNLAQMKIESQHR